MHYLYKEAAKHHELAAEFHRAAAESSELGEIPEADIHIRRALEHSSRASELAAEAHDKSGEIGSI